MLTPPYNQSLVVPDTIPNNGIINIYSWQPHILNLVGKFHPYPQLWLKNISVSCFVEWLTSTCSLVESKWCHWIMVEADNCLKLLPLDIYKVFEHIDKLSMGIWQEPLTVIPTLPGSYFGVLGHLWIQNDVIASWLKCTATSNCFLHPY